MPHMGPPACSHRRSVSPALDSGRLASAAVLARGQFAPYMYRHNIQRSHLGLAHNATGPEASVALGMSLEKVRRDALALDNETERSRPECSSLASGALTPLI